MRTPVVIFNPVTRKARAFESIASAASYLDRDEGTVRKAITGSISSVAGYLAIPVSNHRTKRKHSI